jgi:photosystem II stability/assembly factor-like uncharacterized protein
LLGDFSTKIPLRVAVPYASKVPILNFLDSHAKPSGSKKSLVNLVRVTVFFGALAFGSTFASNISLNDGGNVEFGQGVVQATACDKEIIMTPISAFINGNPGEFKFTGITLSDVDGTDQTTPTDEGCAGNSFRLKAFNLTENEPLAVINISLNDSGAFSSGDGRTVASDEESTNSFVRLTFDEPSILATNVHRITIESEGSPYSWTQLSSFPGGIYVASLENSRNDKTFAIAGSLAENGDFAQCHLYRSNNLGEDWFQVSMTPECFWYMTVSGDGSRIVAANWGGDVYTSADSGLSWTNTGNAGAWWGFSSSGSGQVVVGITEKISVHISHDYGQSWSTPELLINPAGTFTKSAVSEDGQKIMILDSYGYIYLSSDSGATWNQRGEERNWMAAAMSADGTRLYAAESTDVSGITGRIFTSTDFGSTWIPRSINNIWWQLRTSHDGKTVVAMATDKIDSVFISDDYGTSWRRSDQSYYLGDIALSRNGDVLIGSTSSTLWGLLRLKSLLLS